MRGASAERAMCFVVHVVVCSEGGAPVDSLTCGGHGARRSRCSVGVDLDVTVVVLEQMMCQSPGLAPDRIK